ncbi:MAG: hypothetical protein J5734_03355 [Prevotella sp.]|nr:hypothetical protein [Prevotella sp.]MBR5035952.1 hypothetical protein [Prevotella sp.]MBR5697476.1 hypothetical protein [Prevotella sp.]
MKKMMIWAVMMVMTVSANAMSYNAAKNEALFLSDKMAYELGLTAAQYEAVYEINLDYLMSLNGHADVFGIWWDRRNADLRFVLTAWQYDKYMSLAYFYRPVAWTTGSWTFSIYSHYDRSRFFNAHPKVFVTYKGGNSKRDAHFYADRKVTKPSVNHNNPKTHNNKPAVKNDNKTWRNNGNHNGSNNSSNRQVTQRSTQNNGLLAKNTKTNGNGSGHFGGRR